MGDRSTSMIHKKDEHTDMDTPISRLSQKEGVQHDAAPDVNPPRFGSTSCSIQARATTHADRFHRQRAINAVHPMSMPYPYTTCHCSCLFTKHNALIVCFQDAARRINDLFPISRNHLLQSREVQYPCLYT